MYFIQDFKYRNMSNSRILYNIFFDRGSSGVFLYRVSNYFYIKNVKFLAVLIRQLNVILNNCEISYAAEIDSGFEIYHSVGIVIGSVKIGKGFTIFQNITIGKNTNSKNYPTIGNNVTLYTGSVVIGDIIIGDNSIVGANTVVTRDMPNNSKAIGSKALITSFNN